MTIKIIVTILTVVTGLLCVGQSVDTINALNVIVLDESRIATPIRTEDDGGFNYSIDSTQQIGSQQLSTEEYLRQNSTLHFVSSGVNGALSTVRQRGFGSDHTLITWNGVPINNISEGGMDFSNLPNFSNQQIRITNGGTGTFFGSGNFSGVIDFSNRADFKNILSSSLLISYTPLLNATSTNYTFSAGDEKFQTSIQVRNHYSTNDYTYNDPILRKENVAFTHNEFQQRGFVADFFYRPNKKNNFQFSIWSQQKNKSIPKIMGQTLESSKRQLDDNLRSFFSYKKSFKSTEIELINSFQKGNLTYSDKATPTDATYSTYSELDLGKVYSEVSGITKLNKLLTTKGGIINLIQTANVDAYGKTIRINSLALYGSLLFHYKNMKINSSLRQEYSTANQFPLIYAFSGEYGLLGKSVVLKANYSKKYKAPDLNDKYWIPGGNPNLLPESGYGVDIGISGTKNLKKLRLKYFVNYFYINLDDKIVWIPKMSNWGAVNYNHTTSNGSEAHLNLQYKLKKHTIGLILNYTYAKALNHKTGDVYTEGKNLIYSPNHIYSSTSYFSAKYWGVKLISTFTGKTYTTEDNTEIYAIDPYWLHHINIHLRVPYKESYLTINYRINNIFDRYYELRRLYPMPGRHHSFTIQLGINKRKT